MKRRYAIQYNEIFKHGLVKLRFWTIRIKETEVPLDQYTRFRFRFMADFWCRVLQKHSTRKLMLRDYRVIEVFE